MSCCTISKMSCFLSFLFVYKWKENPRSYFFLMLDIKVSLLRLWQPMLRNESLKYSRWFSQTDLLISALNRKESRSPCPSHPTSLSSSIPHYSSVSIVCSSIIKSFPMFFFMFPSQKIFSALQILYLWLISTYSL